MSEERPLPVPKFFFAVSPVACRRCGCRMLTKVGRTAPMLICSDCGLPVDQRQTATLTRQRLWGALTLVAMASVAAAMLLLASMQEMRRPRLLEEGGGSDSKASSQEGEQGGGKGLLEPSALQEEPPPAARAIGPTNGPRTSPARMSAEARAGAPQN